MQESAPIVKVKPQREVIRDLINKQRDEIIKALPKHVDADRLIRIALTTINKTPALLECTTTSLLSCLMDCAALGLEPDNVMGRAYLIPYRDRKKDIVVCTLIIGYKGLVDLAFRSGMVDMVDAYVVHANDRFELTLGLSPNIIHVPALTDPGAATGVYSVIRIKGSPHPKFAFMTRAEIETTRNRSRAGQSGPWVTDWEEMAKKTVLKRNAKTCPMSAEFAEAVARDNEHEREPVITTVEAKVDAKFLDIPKPDPTPDPVVQPDAPVDAQKSPEPDMHEKDHWDVDDAPTSPAPASPRVRHATMVDPETAPAIPATTATETPLKGAHLGSLIEAMNTHKIGEAAATAWLKLNGYLTDSQKLADLPEQQVAFFTKNCEKWKAQINKQFATK